jgi:hypothetical protein
MVLCSRMKSKVYTQLLYFVLLAITIVSTATAETRPFTTAKALIKNKRIIGGSQIPNIIQSSSASSFDQTVSQHQL